MNSNLVCQVCLPSSLQNQSSLFLEKVSGQMGAALGLLWAGGTVNQVNVQRLPDPRCCLQRMATAPAPAPAAVASWQEELGPVEAGMESLKAAGSPSIGLVAELWLGLDDELGFFSSRGSGVVWRWWQKQQQQLSLHLTEVFPELAVPPQIPNWAQVVPRPLCLLAHPNLHMTHVTLFLLLF